MGLVEKYLEGLVSNFDEESLKQFETASGASASDLARLTHRFAQCPQTLLALLAKVDGTYYRAYGGEKILVYMFGTDVGEGSYPYYLMSAEQIVASEVSSIRGIYKDYLYATKESSDEPWLEIDERIDVDATHWLHFSDCMNNGGTSRIYIDFQPSPKGKSGQVIRFLHDPDSFVVIAESFDEFLQNNVDAGYPFLEEFD